jgi:hypothetical protein
MLLANTVPPPPPPALAYLQRPWLWVSTSLKLYDLYSICCIPSICRNLSPLNLYTNQCPQILLPLVAIHTGAYLKSPSNLTLERVSCSNEFHSHLPFDRLWSDSGYSKWSLFEIAIFDNSIFGGVYCVQRFYLSNMLHILHLRYFVSLCGLTVNLGLLY